MLKTLPLCWTYWIYVETHRCVVCRDGIHLACLPDATHDRCRYEGNKISDHMILCWNATNLCWNVMDLMLKHTNLCWNELCAWVSVVIGDTFLVLFSILFPLPRNLEFMLKTMNLCWIPWIYVENQWTVACPEMESTLYATGGRRATVGMQGRNSLTIIWFYVETSWNLCWNSRIYVVTLWILCWNTVTLCWNWVRTDAYESEK